MQSSTSTQSSTKVFRISTSHECFHRGIFETLCQRTQSSTGKCMTVRKPSDQNFGNGVFLVPQFSARSSQAGCAMGFSFLRPSASPMHLGEAALSANAYLSAFGGCTGLSSTWMNHVILGDETRRSSIWIRRAITHRKKYSEFFEQ